MKQYLQISSFGEIDPNAFRLIGASSKRDDTTKIGHFGSGLKYALAYLLRNKVEFKCYSGKQEVLFTTIPTTFREQNFDVICVNGQATSMTTTMGVEWPEWGMIREIYCNAIDEGSDEVKEVEECLPQEGTTTFFIRLGAEGKKILANWDLYFSEKRKDLVFYNTDLCKLYTGGTKTLVYRKGIQCFLDESCVSLFHYDMPWAEINESRVLTNDRYFFSQLGLWVATKCADVKILKELLKNIRGKNEESFDWDWYGYSDAWLEAIGDHFVVNSDVGGYFADFIENHKVYQIPASMIRGLKKSFPSGKIKILGDQEQGTNKLVVPSTNKQLYILKGVMEFFKEARYEIVASDIQICKFSSDTQLGEAANKIIYLSERVFSHGRRMVAETICEENEHIKSGFSDNTRLFQDHLIRQIISQIEERVGTFL